MSYGAALPQDPVEIHRISDQILAPLSAKLQAWAEQHGVETIEFSLIDAGGQSFCAPQRTPGANAPLFLMGSQSKVLTAFVAAGALARHGIALEQPVLDWWPGARRALPRCFQATTSLALLSHRSAGFRSEYTDMRRRDGRHLPRASALSDVDLTAHLRTYLGPVAGGGAPFVYSDIAYLLLALALDEALGLSLEQEIRRQITDFDLDNVFYSLRLVPEHCAHTLVSGSLCSDGCRISLPPIDLAALNPALGCIASAEGMARLYNRVLANKAWQTLCTATAAPIKPDRADTLYSIGLTHFHCPRSACQILGHIGIYNGCTGATLCHPLLRLTASLQLNRIDLDSRSLGEYRMIFVEQFLLALFDLIGQHDSHARVAPSAIDELLSKLSR